MKLLLTDTEAIQIMTAIKEKMFRHQTLSALAMARSKSNKYSKNAEKLRTEHKSKSEAAQTLINKIVEQL